MQTETPQYKIVICSYGRNISSYRSHSPSVCPTFFKIVKAAELTWLARRMNGLGCRSSGFKAQENRWGVTATVASKEVVEAFNLPFGLKVGGLIDVTPQRSHSRPNHKPT